MSITTTFTCNAKKLDSVVSELEESGYKVLYSVIEPVDGGELAHITARCVNNCNDAASKSTKRTCATSWMLIVGICLVLCCLALL